MPDRKPASELAPGDVVEHDGARFEVCGEPFLGATGASVFDSFALFWRVMIRPLDDSAPAAYGTWPVDALVTVAGRRAA